MSSETGQTAAPGEIEPRERRLTVESFISALAAIAPQPHPPFSPESHLIEDLGFDAIAFDRLELLVYERYGICGLPTASLRTESLTVEGFFQSCVLDVLGMTPKS